MKLFVASMIAACVFAADMPKEEMRMEEARHHDGPDFERELENAVRDLGEAYNQWVYQDENGMMRIRDVPDLAWKAVSKEEQQKFIERNMNKQKELE